MELDQLRKRLITGPAAATVRGDTGGIGRASSPEAAFPYERNENFISEERVFESGGVIVPNAQADDSSPSARLRAPAA